MDEQTKQQGFIALHARVVAEGGMLEVGMSELRDLVGAGKLGCRVLDEISLHLGAAKLTHFPIVLPDSQTHKLTLFARDTVPGELMAIAVRVWFERSRFAARTVA